MSLSEIAHETHLHLDQQWLDHAFCNFVREKFYKSSILKTLEH